MTLNVTVHFKVNFTILYDLKGHCALQPCSLRKSENDRNYLS